MKFYTRLYRVCYTAVDSVFQEKQGVSMAFIFVSLCLPVKCEHLSQRKKLDFFKNLKLNLPFKWKDNDIYRIDEGYNVTFYVT